MVPLLRAMVMELDGWRRRGLAFAAGGASVLAMAPFFVFPVLWLTLPILVWLVEAPVAQSQPAEEKATRRERVRRLLSHPAVAAAGAGWWFGFGYFFAGLFWVGEAFLVEAEVFAVLLPLAVTVLPAGLALFWGAATGMVRLYPLPTISRVLALAVTLSLAEYLRGHVLTGFPWNTLGYALTWPLPLAQASALLGIYGLTLVAVLVFALPLVMWARTPAGPEGRRDRVMALALALAPLATLFLFGLWRLSGPLPANVASAKIRIVQPSVPQREKWRPENQERIFEDHLALSVLDPEGKRDDLAGISHVVWPEAAMPFLPLDYPVVSERIGAMLPGDTYLIAGALRAEYSGEGPTRRRTAIFNSILVFDGSGSLAGVYDKIHLVPFGEYLPFQRFLEAIGLEQLTRMRGGFNSGPKPRPVMHLTRLPPMLPLVCYEAIFPAAVVQGRERPGVLVNLTNDGWFGNSTGPRQHFHQSRIRAIEEGVPLVRAANNGISGAFDPFGRVLGTLGMNIRGTLDASLPRAIAPPPYARIGDFPFFLGLGLVVVFLVWRRV